MLWRGRYQLQPCPSYTQQTRPAKSTHCDSDAAETRADALGAPVAPEASRTRPAHRIRPALQRREEVRSFDATPLPPTSQSTLNRTQTHLQPRPDSSLPKFKNPTTPRSHRATSPSAPQPATAPASTSNSPNSPSPPPPLPLHPRSSHHHHYQNNNPPPPLVTRPQTPPHQTQQQHQQQRQQPQTRKRSRRSSRPSASCARPCSPRAATTISPRRSTSSRRA